MKTLNLISKHPDLFTVRRYSPSIKLQDGGSSLIGCPQLFILYIRSYPQYLEAIRSICNWSTLHAVVHVPTKH